MVKRTGPSNSNLQGLIRDLKKLSTQQKVQLWKRIASDLEKPTRIRRTVNLYKIEKNTRPGEIALVPGKILSLGDLTKKIEISAYQISDSALEKINQAGVKFLPLPELMQKNPNGKKVRIIG